MIVNSESGSSISRRGHGWAREEAPQGKLPAEASNLTPPGAGGEAGWVRSCRAPGGAQRALSREEARHRALKSLPRRPRPCLGFRGVSPAAWEALCAGEQTTNTHHQSVVAPANGPGGHRAVLTALRRALVERVHLKTTAELDFARAESPSGGCQFVPVSRDRCKHRRRLGWRAARQDARGTLGASARTPWGRASRAWAGSRGNLARPRRCA